jgi:hypothetical protein
MTPADRTTREARMDARLLLMIAVGLCLLALALRLRS